MTETLVYSVTLTLLAMLPVDVEYRQVDVTAYVDHGDDCWTASGARTRHGVCACTQDLPFGAAVLVPGYGWCSCLDRGRLAEYGVGVDVWMEERARALWWGRRRLGVWILRPKEVGCVEEDWMGPVRAARGRADGGQLRCDVPGGAVIPAPEWQQLPLLPGVKILPGADGDGPVAADRGRGRRRSGVLTPEQLREVDPNFVRDLKRSDSVAWLLAEWIGQSCCVAKWPLRVRPSEEERRGYRDCGDLFVVCDRTGWPYSTLPGRGQSVVFVPIGVKGRNNIDFTCSADYPYGTVMVDVAYLWDEAVVKPKGYVIANRSRTHAAIVPGYTSEHWYLEDKDAESRGRERVYYLCPKKHVRWVVLATDPFRWEWLTSPSPG